MFYMDYSDIQVQGFTSATGVAPIYVNGSSARVQGFELELQAAPAGEWFFEAGAGFLDDKYLELPAGVIGLDTSKSFERLSKWTLNAALQNTLFLDRGFGSLTPRLAWSYRSKAYNDAANTEQIAQPGYSLVNASLRWRSGDGRWSVLTAVNNVTDRDYIVAAAYNPIVRSYSVVPARGREWSVMAQVDF
jgi:iron complex outermembrane receptor protein